MPSTRRCLILSLIAVALTLAASAYAAPADAPDTSLVAKQWSIDQPDHEIDYPNVALDAGGTPWLVYVDHDGEADVVRLARQTADGLTPVVDVSQRGIVHQPAIAVDASGGVWCFWGQVDARDIMTLRARRYADGKLADEITLAESAGSDTFADTGVDADGRVWVVWQSMRRGHGDIFARWRDAKTGEWSKPIEVSEPVGGNWEPRLAFAKGGGAWVVFDASPQREFNVYLAHVQTDGAVKRWPITDTPRYEARASIAPTAEGDGFWIAAERGNEDWGKPSRGHENYKGLNGQKILVFGRFDIAAGRFDEIAMPGGGRMSKGGTETNLPAIGVDAKGQPWLAWRFYIRTHWMINVAKFDPAAGKWSDAVTLPNSVFGEDRRAVFARHGDTMWLAWPTDGRKAKAPVRTVVYLAQLNPPASVVENPAPAPELLERKPYLHEPVPPRPFDEHHTWEIGGKKYTLVYGDLHRHTDISNCRTGEDGCINEGYRYAIDVAGLDFLGLSDHTDIVKTYTPYEWWQNQRFCDVFYTPGRFTGMYAYEREQRYLWGHRNVVFAQRGGPIVYIHRNNYQNSPWAKLYPVKNGGNEIDPTELWDVLNKYGKPVAVVSHTGATGMGTDWTKYKEIDNRVENTVEIYQGARVSYEGLGAPQPTVGLRVGEKYTADTGAKANIPAPPEAIKTFGDIRNNGVYQQALKQGFTLGVFACSDHISTGVAFGGVYVEENSRLGIVEGLRQRHSIAATDKIFLEFSCNDHPMGEVFDVSGDPAFRVVVQGTAPIQRVTLVRNEFDFKSWEPGKKDFTLDFTDTDAKPGKSRYYLRVEQTDGNMAWSSPVWLTISKPRP
ncbi:MAG: hypothetical protein GC159_02285 [Phycisphaera sp.]|nr:hypothetical protein [Phycisphaera sp.]